MGLDVGNLQNSTCTYRNIKSLLLSLTFLHLGYLYRSNQIIFKKTIIIELLTVPAMALNTMLTIWFAPEAVRMRLVYILYTRANNDAGHHSLFYIYTIQDYITLH